MLTEAPDSAAAMRVRFATDVLEEVERRKRRLGVLSYDDLLSQLADALSRPRRPRPRTRCDRRWKFVLIDEFQDTDPVQWQVFQRAFADSTTMVLIGDPKQAIYAFRGGDIVTYLAAAERGAHHPDPGGQLSLRPPLLDGLQAVLEGADPRRPAHRRPPRRGALRVVATGRAPPPFRLRVVRRNELDKGPRSKPPVAAWREHVITDAAHDIKRLIQSGTTFEGAPWCRRHRGAGGAPQRARGHPGSPPRGRRPLGDQRGRIGFHTPAAGEW